MASVYEVVELFMNFIWSLRKDINQIFKVFEATIYQFMKSLEKFAF
jgi:hypothetical protein